MQICDSVLKRQWIDTLIEAAVGDKMLLLESLRTLFGTIMSSRCLLVPRLAREAIDQSTAHGINRVASLHRRDSKLRAFWLLSFLSCSVLLVYTSRTYIYRLRSPGIATELNATDAEFEFPDLYFCNTLQVAGSYSALLNSSEWHRLMKPLISAYRLYNTTVAGAANWTAEELYDLQRSHLLGTLQSMPYSLLADLVGQRRNQTFFRNYGVFSAGSEQSLDSPVEIETLHHPEHLKCFKVALTESERSRMRNINNRLRFDIWLDPYYSVMKSVGLYSSYFLPWWQFENRLFYPYDWDLSNPHEIDRGSGMLLYLVPRGHYPSRLTTNVVSLGPGRAYDISVEMSDSQLKPADFPDECLDAPPDQALFFDPHTGAADAFGYSEAVCFYTEMAREALARYNCSPWPQPLPWRLRDLALCLNLTAVTSGSPQSQELNMRAYLAASRSESPLSDNWERLCMRSKLCRQRQYRVTSSFGNWPNSVSEVRFLSNLLPFALKNKSLDDYRSIEAAMRALQFIQGDTSIDDLISFEDKVHAYFRRALLSVTIRAESSVSQLITFSLDYSLGQFVADLGGSLGLHLGCSVLTLLELFELLHQLLVAAWKHCRMRS